MKKYELNDITLMQFIFMIHGAQLGIGILSLPAILAKSAGTDGWISLLIGWAIAVLASLLIIQVMKKHPENTLYDIIPCYFGKVVGGVINICIICYFAFAFFTCFYASILIMKLEMLTKTPTPLVVLLFLIPTYTIVRNHVRVLSRYAELTFWGLSWLFLVYIKPLSDAHWLNLLPILKEGWKPVMGAVKLTGLSFLGFETAFILYPFLKHKKDAVKGVIIANTLTLVEYMIIILTCFIFFSPDDIISYRFPVIKMIKTIEFRFLDRVDIVILVAYLFMLSKVWMFYLYCSMFGTIQILGKQDHKLHLIIMLTGMFLVSMFYTPSNGQIDFFMDLFGKLGSYFAFAFPLFLLAYTKIFAGFTKET
jgi:spore germination protein (amino acid permease)